jgi:hypothetical protein
MKAFRVGGLCEKVRQSDIAIPPGLFGVQEILCVRERLAMHGA